MLANSVIFFFPQNNKIKFTVITSEVIKWFPLKKKNLLKTVKSFKSEITDVIVILVFGAKKIIIIEQHAHTFHFHLYFFNLNPNLEIAAMCVRLCFFILPHTD